MADPRNPIKSKKCQATVHKSSLFAAIVRQSGHCMAKKAAQL
jgi:hypothetical protein